MDFKRMRNMPFEWDEKNPHLYDIRLAIGDALGGICTSHPDWLIDSYEGIDAYKDAYFILLSAIHGSDKERQEAEDRARHYVECAYLHRKARFAKRESEKPKEDNATNQ